MHRKYEWLLESLLLYTGAIFFYVQYSLYIYMANAVHRDNRKCACALRGIVMRMAYTNNRCSAATPRYPALLRALRQNVSFRIVHRTYNIYFSILPSKVCFDLRQFQWFAWNITRESALKSHGNLCWERAEIQIGIMPMGTGEFFGFRYPGGFQPFPGKGCYQASEVSLAIY